MTAIGEITLESVLRAQEIQRRNKLATYYPDGGPLRRELYVKHLEFFSAGRKYRERAAIAANRVGKTEGIGAYETTLHLTGRYPEWWKGKRFSKPISAWVAGDTTQTTRDIVQAKLLGKMHRDPGEPVTKAVGVGTGMIPADAIKSTKPKAGVPDAIEVVYVRHVSGGLSVLTFKSYEQGRESFQGTEQDLVWLDEECDEGIYNECLMRTMATGAFAGGIMLLTFTPLRGWSEVVDRFLDAKSAKDSARFVVQIGWDDAPHLSVLEKVGMLAKLPPHERESRSKGIPRLGSGAIYPVDFDLLKEDPLEIPKHWPRGYALDVGQHTAAVWAAYDRQADVLHLYAEYKRDDADISVHAGAIKAKGDWIPGFIDPAANGRSQTDGQRVIELYRKQGLIVSNADNAVEAGLYDVWERMVSGRLKIFASLSNLFGELRLYRRDEKGRIVKKNDHLCDCLRYVTRAIANLVVQPAPKGPPEARFINVPKYGQFGGGGNSGAGWMAG